MLRPDAGVVQAGRHRVRLLDLAVLVLHEVAAHAVDDARARRGRPPPHRPARHRPVGPCVSTNPAEDPGRVGSSADAGDDDVGVVAGQGPGLRPRLVADHPVQLAHHPRVRVRAHHRAEAVVGVADGGHPVAQRLVDGVLQRPAAAVHGFDGGAEQAHAEHVERLAIDVDGAHVDLALQAEQRRCGGRGDAVLAGAGLGDEAGLAHPLGQQRLAEDVVDLVRPGVVEVLALQQQPHAQLTAEVVALGDDRRAPGVVAQDVVELPAEDRVGPRLAEGRLQLLARRHERLGHEAPAELAEAAGRRGLPHQALDATIGLRSLVAPVVGQLVAADVRRRRRRTGRAR